MIKKIVILASFIVLFSVPVAALESPTTDGTEDSQPTTSTESEETESKSAREERIKARKEAVKEKLTAAKRERLKNRCLAAQQKIGDIEKRLVTVKEKRQKNQQELLSKLQTLQQKLSNEGNDTTSLLAAIEAYKTKIASFDAAITSYVQTVADLKDMDCAIDPEGFHASLEAARDIRSTVMQSAADVRAHVENTIKPLLAALKTQLTQAESE